MSDLPSVAPGKSWWVGLCDVHKPNPTDQMDENADGAYCWVAVPASSEDDAMKAIMRAAQDDGLVVEGVEDLQPVSSIDEVRELDENLSEAFGSYSAGDTAAWGTLNLYETEAA